jgi:DNA-binding response OmpR family regulator
VAQFLSVFKSHLKAGNMRKRVLIIDDDPDILEVTKIILQSEDYDVSTCSSGNVIFELKDRVPDIIVLDVMLGMRDGKELCNYIKDAEHLQHIPVVMFSAQSQEETDKLYSACSPDYFLAKPFDIREIKAAVKKLLFPVGVY